MFPVYTLIIIFYDLTTMRGRLRPARKQAMVLFLNYYPFISRAMLAMVQDKFKRNLRGGDSKEAIYGVSTLD